MEFSIKLDDWSQFSSFGKMPLSTMPTEIKGSFNNSALSWSDVTKFIDLFFKGATPLLWVIRPLT